MDCDDVFIPAHAEGYRDANSVIQTFELKWINYDHEYWFMSDILPLELMVRQLIQRSLDLV